MSGLPRSTVTLGSVQATPADAVVALPEPTPWPRASARPADGGLPRRRVVAGLVLAAVLLPALTVALVQVRPSVHLINELLLYLLAVIGVTLVGGFWTALVTALAADLLLNWYFVVPLHHWTIAQPADLAALLLFIACAVSVSGVVHLAARRAADAAERAAEARALLDLARTVFSGDDSADAVLGHLTRTLAVPAQLYERHGDGWVRVAGSRSPVDEPVVTAAGTSFRLVTAGRPDATTVRLLPAYAAQAAAATERHRLRIQANQAEALAEGNRMRTALLAAVSHDLRSPLASLKAAVGTLRQTDIDLSPEDSAALLATIEEGADRLDALIANLLDMSRVQTGSVQPLLRPSSLEEIAPLAVRGLDGGERVVLHLPDTVPLVDVDPGLLERALANVVGNALRYSPPERPASLVAEPGDDPAVVTVLVRDHGPGVAAAARELIFAPFQQLGDATTVDGVGLGLAVARGFVEAMGGTITAEDTPGGGLTMRIRLRASPSRTRVTSR